MSLRNFIAVLAALVLAGCGGSKVTEKESKPDSLEPGIVQGFRVQLFSTPAIDEAKAKKAKAEAAFPDQWFYLVYDAPTYKVRGGNFAHRAEADAYAKFLTEKGFPDAWIVPEKVVKNPQLRNLQQQEDKKQ